nr:reverse transcriptase domain-containing protein [Tanacetum cinerariifolium]
MVDNRTMAELLQAPTEGYEDAIVIPEIAANNFELKHARIWLEKEPPRSIQTWDDLVSKFINQFFPPLKTTNLRNEITRFQQRFDESFYEAWNCFNELLRSCPHHGFSELHQLDTFYNALNVNDQDSLNSAAGGNFLDKMARECLKIIENKSKVRQSRAKAVVAKVDKKNQSLASTSSPNPASVKAVKPNCVTCGGANFNQGQLHRPQVNQPSAYQVPIPQTQNVSNTDFESYIKANDAILRNMQSQCQRTKVTKDQVQIPSSQSTAPVQPPVSQSKIPTLNSEPVVAPVSALMPNVKSSIPYPLRRDNERRRDQANEQIEKFYEIFKDMSFEIRFTDALILMPKFSYTLKALIGNKEKLSEMARTPMNEHCSAVILNKLPRKLGDPADFVVVDFKPDPRVLLILGRCFLKNDRALIDVHKGELTLRIENEAITYNLDQTLIYSANYNQMTANKIDVICEEYSQEVLSFFDVTASGNPTPHDDPIISTTSPTLTPFGTVTSYSLRKPMLFSVCEAKTVKSSVDEPPEVELKDLPPHFEYVFLEGDNKLPVIIAKELGDEEKSTLIKVLKSHKRAIAWKLSDIQ